LSCFSCFRSFPDTSCYLFKITTIEIPQTAGVDAKRIVYRFRQWLLRLPTKDRKKWRDFLPTKVISRMGPQIAEIWSMVELTVVGELSTLSCGTDVADWPSSERQQTFFHYEQRPGEARRHRDCGLGWTQRPRQSVRTTHLTSCRRRPDIFVASIGPCRGSGYSPSRHASCKSDLSMYAAGAIGIADSSIAPS